METTSLQSILEKIEYAKSNGLNKVEVELKYNPDIEDNPITSELVKMSYRTQHSSNDILTVFWGRTITVSDVEEQIMLAKNSGESNVTVNVPEEFGEAHLLMMELLNTLSCNCSADLNGYTHTLTIFFKDG